MTTLLDDSKVFCEVIARNKDKENDNDFDAVVRGAVQDEWKGKWNKQVLTYCVIKGSEDADTHSFQYTAINLLMTMWDIEIDLDLHPVKKDDNPDIRIYWKTSQEEEYFKENPATLAFAYYPAQGSSSGIIVFNEDYYWNLTGKGVPAHSIDPRYPPSSPVLIKGYNLLGVGGHEMGHCLGLTHSTRNQHQDLMDPIYNKNLYWLSEYDILRIIKKYEREHYRRWAHLGILRRWLRRRIARFSIK